MAKATKLPSGNYRVQAYKNVNGKKIKKSFTAATAKQAQLAAARWQAAQSANVDPDRLTLREAFNKYFAAKENVLSPSTLKGYYKIGKNHLKGIMDLPLSKLTNEQIQRAINVDAATASPKTIRNVHGLLSSVLKMFYPQFALKTTLPQKKKTEMYIPDDEVIRKLLKCAKGTSLEIPILLAAFGPMRRGEICALTSDDIHGNIITVNKSLVTTQEGDWIVKQPKTYSSYRDIDYPDFVIQKIKNIKGQIVPISPNTISTHFKELLEKNNLPHFRFHDLRHYNVSILHAMNVPDKYIMQRGGWSSNYTMNNVYNHTLKSKSDAITQQINSYFNSEFEKSKE